MQEQVRRRLGLGLAGGAQIPHPKIGDWHLALVLGSKSSRPIFGILLVAVALVLALMVSNIRRSGIGRRMLAVRSNERAASAAGINIASVKLLVFTMSAFIAGIAGTLTAYRFGAVSDVSFGTVASLTALAVAYLGGITSVSGAVTSGIVATSGVSFFAMSEVIGSLGTWETFIGGVLLILTAILNPEGIAGAVRGSVADAREKKADKVHARQPRASDVVGIST